MEAERLFFAQKAKCTFLNQGDGCTKFYHDYIKRRNKRSSVTALTKPDEIVTTDAAEIASEFLNYYQNLLGQSVPRTILNREAFRNGNFVNHDMGQSLTQRITHEEVKHALFDIDDGKSPGPDGFSSFFFKKRGKLLVVTLWMLWRSFSYQGKC